MKKYDLARICSFVLFFLGSFYSNAQNWQVSGEFSVNVPYNGYPFSTCLNSDGTILATGCGSTGTTIVRIKNGNTWDQLGNVIQDDYHLGCALSLNKDGNVLMVSDPYYNTALGMGAGKINVYQLDNNNWVQKGKSIFGTPSFYQPNGGSEGFPDQLGCAVDIDNSGNTIAIASPFSNGRGQVQVYSFSNNDWVLKGEVFKPNTETLFVRYGNSISLSSDGNSIAIGCMNFTNQAGMVEVYQYDSSGWRPKGTTIIGEAINDCFGQCISMSDDANSIVVSSPFFQNDQYTTEQAVYAQVFTFKNGSWSQKGQKLYPSTVTEGNEYMVRMSGNGKIIVLDYLRYGVADTYSFNTCSKLWEAAGEPIVYGVCTNFGQSLSLNYTGTVLSVGANSNYLVYENESLGVEKLNNQTEVSLSPNPTQNTFYVNNINEPAKVIIEDINGKFILEREINPVEDAIDLTGLALGTYLVKIEYNEQHVLKRIILN